MGNKIDKNTNYMDRNTILLLTLSETKLTNNSRQHGGNSYGGYTILMHDTEHPRHRLTPNNHAASIQKNKTSPSNRTHNWTNDHELQYFTNQKLYIGLPSLNVHCEDSKIGPPTKINKSEKAFFNIVTMAKNRFAIYGRISKVYLGFLTNYNMPSPPNTSESVDPDTHHNRIHQTRLDFILLYFTLLD